MDVRRFVPPPITLASDALLPLPHQFRAASDLHGQSHVARVMVHAFRLVTHTGLLDEARRLWGAVYLHDLERRHDGVCHAHGRWAWERFERDAALQERLASGGVSPEDWPAIETAVTRHSLPGELQRDHPHWVLTALLKDADALDRVRIDDLDVSYLRFGAAVEMEEFAWELYRRTDDLRPGPDIFEKVLHEASRLQAGGPAR